MKRNWSGLLIEPIPQLFQKLVSRNRKAFAINACIANDKPMIARFQIGDALSGRDDAMSEDHKKRLNNENPIELYVTVPCFSLNTILNALGVHKIDMFSLDVEGGELDVLKTIDFNELDIETFVIEHNARQESIKQYKELFQNISDNKYEEIKVTGQDSFYLKIY